MKLTNYIIDMGRVVAYYPNLKKITGSTTASILLCQFLYWIDKTKTGWIYKDSFEIEEETGLSVYEQQTARKILIELNILTEEYKRLDHKIAFKINQEVLNNMWEHETGKQSTPRFQKNEEEPLDLKDFQNPELHKNDPVPVVSGSSTIEKKGDLVDGMLFYANSPGARREMVENEIRDKMERKLHINMLGKKWEGFIKYVYGRQERHNEPVDKFIEYAIKKGFDPMYWTPEKCLTMYPQAFIKEEDKIREDFAPKPTEHVEENYADMPEHLKKKRKLY